MQFFKLISLIFDLQPSHSAKPKKKDQNSDPWNVLEWQFFEASESGFRFHVKSEWPKQVGCTEKMLFCCFDEIV